MRGRRQGQAVARPLAKPGRSVLEAASDGDAPSPTETRKVSDFASRGMVDYSVYDRTHLRPGHKLAGPAIIEEMTSTTVMHATRELVVDESGNLIITTR